MITRGDRQFSGDVISLLFTDIEGSTTLWETQPSAMSEALERHDNLLRRAIESHDGEVFKTIGDAFCAAFASTHDSVAAAVAAQQLLAEEIWPAGARLRVRMAVHAGECEQRDHDFFGPTVNRIARLLAIGHGDQILLSGVAADLLASRPLSGVTVVDKGEHRLKDLGRREHVFEVRLSGQASEFPPLRSLDNPKLKHNLPEQWTSFVGRVADLRQLSDLLRSHRLITLIGPGGTGKTRLALQAVADLVDCTPGGVWLVELAPITEPGNVEAAVADTLGVTELPGRSRLDSLVDALSDRFLVVVLDTCEHVVEAAAEVAERLLRRCPNVTVLATSREPLQIDGEHLFLVPTLSMPSSTTTLEESDAVRLLIDRAQQHRPDFNLENEDASTVASLVRRLDGIPLAIELAVARMSSMSLTDIHERLDQRFRLLIGGSRRALPRQRTLRSLVDWSYALLTTQEQLVLQRLTVFPSTWTLAAAELIAADERVSRTDVADIHDSLVTKNLVQRVDHETGTRFRLLDTIRDYAEEKLLDDQPNAEASLRRRHLDAYIDICAPDSWTFETDDTSAQIEIDNMWQAVETASLLPHDNRHLRLAVVLQDCLDARSARHAIVLRALLEQAGDAASSDAVRAWLALGIHSAYTDCQFARHAHQHAVRIATQIDDDEALAQSLLRLAQFELIFGDGAQAALAISERALRCAQKSGKKKIVWKAMVAHGFVLQNLGDLNGAKSEFQSALGTAWSRNDPYGTAETLCALAESAILLEDWPLARDALARAQDIQSVRELPWFSCVIQTNLAIVAHHDGRLAEALANLHCAMSTLASTDGYDPVLAICALFVLANVALAFDDPVDAAIMLGAGSAMSARTGLNSDRLALTQHDKARGSATETLGAARFTEAYEHGCQLSDDEGFAIVFGYRPGLRNPV